MRKTIAILALLALAACDTVQKAEQQIFTQDVDKPVAASCIPKNLPDIPSYPDTDAALLAAQDAAARYQLIAVGRGMSRAWEAQVAPVIAKCKEAQAQ